MSTYRVKIYRPAKTAMQSGKGKTHLWKLEYEKPAPGTPDALMGWNTMPDTVTEIHLHFATKEEAIAYAVAKKLDYTVSEPKKAVVPPKAYAENFSAAKRKAWDSNC
ncbi:MAG: ETC complex I subunit [Rickettsiales bacterium]